MALYTSEFAQFMRDKLIENPEWKQGQEEGKRLLWDHPIDWQAEQNYEKSKLAQKSYPYDVAFK